MVPARCLLATAAGLLAWSGLALSTRPEDSLRQYLERNFNSRPAPNDGDVVNVFIGLSDAYVKFLQEGAFPSSGLISAWLTAKWNDPRIDWSQHWELTQTSRVTTRLKTWTPDLRVLDAAGKTGAAFEGEPEFLVSRNGDVMVAVPLQVETGCDWINNRRTVVCPFTLGSMLTSTELVDFRPISDANFTARFPGWGWRNESTIRRVEVLRECCPKPFAALEVRVMWSRPQREK